MSASKKKKPGMGAIKREAMSKHGSRTEPNLQKHAGSHGIGMGKAAKLPIKGAHPLKGITMPKRAKSNALVASGKPRRKKAD